MHDIVIFAVAEHWLMEKLFTWYFNLQQGIFKIYKRNTVDNYRAISISPIISKIFEHCVLSKFSKFFDTSPNQFGFKKKSSCAQAT